MLHRIDVADARSGPDTARKVAHAETEPEQSDVGNSAAKHKRFLAVVAYP
jgi:hypothetical protein